MRKYLSAFIIMLLSLLSAGCSSISNSDVVQEYNTNEQTIAVESEGNAMTMKQALSVADTEAKKWAEDAEVFLINSTDYLDTVNTQHGNEGERNCWSFAFKSEEKEKQFHIYVVEGKVYSTDEAYMKYYDIIDVDRLALDSSDAYEMAKDKGISGGVDWAYGYHYLLQYYIVDQNIEEPVLLFVVRGINDSGNEVTLDIDPYTGNLIQYTEKTGYDENGRAVWEVKERYGNNNYSEELLTDETADTESSLSREDIQKEYDVFSMARQNYMDPEELTDAIINGIGSGNFSPFSDTKSYEPEEWEKIMTERYGDDWKNW